VWVHGKEIPLSRTSRVTHQLQRSTVTFETSKFQLVLLRRLPPFPQPLTMEQQRCPAGTGRFVKSFLYTLVRLGPGQVFTGCSGHYCWVIRSHSLAAQQSAMEKKSGHFAGPIAWNVNQTSRNIQLRWTNVLCMSLVVLQSHQIMIEGPKGTFLARFYCNDHIIQSCILL
jgi:hypothetical protein